MALMEQLLDDAQICTLLDQVLFNSEGLVAVTAQDDETSKVLMLAWMNRDALAETLKSGYAVYFSRSRQALWRKGETSGQTQKIRQLLLDCDRDAILIKVTQTGVACHTGRLSCFSWRPEGDQWVSSAPILKDPNELYGKKV